jgi:hypothetical protein
LNCTVECSPLLGPQLFDVIETVLAAKKLTLLDIFQHGLPKDIHAHTAKHKLLKPSGLDAPGEGIFNKRVAVEEGVFDQSQAKKLIDSRQY